MNYENTFIYISLCCIKIFYPMSHLNHMFKTKIHFYKENKSEKYYALSKKLVKYSITRVF
jgi:hypothetical protein